MDWTSDMERYNLKKWTGLLKRIGIILKMDWTYEKDRYNLKDELNLWKESV
jgi:hypothetical protein